MLLGSKYFLAAHCSIRIGKGEQGVARALRPSAHHGPSLAGVTKREMGIEKSGSAGGAFLPHPGDKSMQPAQFVFAGAIVRNEYGEMRRNVYPTVENLCEFVRRKAPKDKTLILVGGSSILLGVRQKQEKLWSKILQEKLGPDFAVVNISFRGCGFGSVGVPIAEILSKEYARWYFVNDLF